jgi:DhnA family fructose-bisphosphate aldolase class Ia
MIKMNYEKLFYFTTLLLVVLVVILIVDNKITSSAKIKAKEIAQKEKLKEESGTLIGNVIEAKCELVLLQEGDILSLLPEIHRKVYKLVKNNPSGEKIRLSIFINMIDTYGHKKNINYGVLEIDNSEINEIRKFNDPVSFNSYGNAYYIGDYLMRNLHRIIEY